MNTLYFISLLVVCLLTSSSPAFAAEVALEKLLPVPACAENWLMDGKAALYDRDNLFERINGESELYFPYGFELLASARYADKKNPNSALEADIYRMGSLLDAFGMYANYRRKDDPDAGIGAEGSVSASQLFFYQGRF